MKRNQESHRSLFLQYDLPTSLLLLKQRRLIRAYSVSRSMRPALVEDALDAPAEKGPIEAITHPLRSFGWKLRILRLSLYNTWFDACIDASSAILCSSKSNAIQRCLISQSTQFIQGLPNARSFSEYCSQSPGIVPVCSVAGLGLFRDSILESETQWDGAA